MASESASPTLRYCADHSQLSHALYRFIGWDPLSIINIFYASKKCFCFIKKGSVRLFHAFWKYSIILLAISYVFETKYNFHIDSEFACSWWFHWFPLISKIDNPLYIYIPVRSIQTNAHNTISSDTTLKTYHGPCVRYDIIPALMHNWSLLCRFVWRNRIAPSVAIYCQLHHLLSSTVKSEP